MDYTTTTATYSQGNPETVVPKSANDILESIHLNQRQVERNISNAELDAAIKHGKQMPGLKNRGRKTWKISYGDITFLTDYDMKVGMTSWVNPCFGFVLEKVFITNDMIRSHKEALEKRNDYDSWHSHAVTIVDQRCV